MLLLTLFLVLSVTGSILLTIHFASGIVAVLFAAAVFCGIYLALIVLFLLILYISSLFVDLSKEQVRRSRYFTFLVHQFLHITFFFAGIRIHAKGLELVPKDKTFLLVSNHIYDLDPCIYMLKMPWAKLGFISKKENYSLFVVNKAMHKLQCVPVDRENDRMALKSIIKTAHILREGEHSMGAFPEGYESKDGKLLPFRNGVFKAAQRSGVPIVVCVLRGTKEIARNMFRRCTHVEMEVLGVIPAEEITNQVTRSVGDRIHEMMEEALERKSAV